MITEMDTFERIALGCLILIGLVAAIILFVYAPASAHAQKLCLEQGYPRYAMTWDLDVYCVNLDGSVTTKVVKQ